MILSDHTILKRLMNNEFGTNLSKEKTKIGPASIDFQIDDEFLILETYRDKEGKDSLRYRKIDLVDPNYPEHFTIPGNLCFLGSTNVSIEIPSDLCAHVQGRSSIGRLFLEVHQFKYQVLVGMTLLLAFFMSWQERLIILFGVGEVMALAN